MTSETCSFQLPQKVNPIYTQPSWPRWRAYSASIWGFLSVGFDPQLHWQPATRTFKFTLYTHPKSYRTITETTSIVPQNRIIITNLTIRNRIRVFHWYLKIPVWVYGAWLKRFHFQEHIYWEMLLKYGRPIAKCDPWIYRATQGPTMDIPFGDQWIP